MIATPQEIQTLENYFTTTTLLKELHLNPAVHIINLPAYIKQVIENLKKDRYFTALTTFLPLLILSLADEKTAPLSPKT